MIRRTTIAAVFAALVTACASNGPPPDPTEVALAESREAIVQGVEEGVEETEGRDAYAVLARYNPGACDGPPHEAFYRGRWNRVFLEGSDPVELQIREFDQAARTSDPLLTLVLRGVPSGTRTGDDGREYPVFDVVAVGAEDVLEAEE